MADGGRPLLAPGAVTVRMVASIENIIQKLKPTPIMEQTNTSAPPVIATVAIDEFKSSIRGTVLFAGDVEYDLKRQVWNGMIDKHPALSGG